MLMYLCCIKSKIAHRKADRKFIDVEIEEFKKKKKQREKNIKHIDLLMNELNSIDMLWQQLVQMRHNVCL